MRYLILALALTLPLSVGAFNPEDLEKLKKTNECLWCDLSGANLTDADLYEAKLRYANLKGAFLRSAILCKTIMPDGSVNNSGC